MEEKENNVVYVDFNSKEKVIPIHDSNFLTTITLKIKKLFKYKSSNKCNKNSNKKRCYNNVP